MRSQEKIARSGTAATLLFACAVTCAACFGGDVVRGSFVQRKTLHDVGIVLESSGTWSFEKDKAFVWNTLKPLPSSFFATPTNYSFTAGGRTVSRRLDMKIGNLAQVFEMKEMKGVVDRVESDGANPVFRADGMEIPSALRVVFKNGDRLEISLKR